jgi:hypothetical protein
MPLFDNFILPPAAELTIGGLSLSNLPSLTSLSFMKSIKQVLENNNGQYGYIALQDLPKLVDVSGMSSCVSGYTS